MKINKGSRPCHMIQPGIAVEYKNSKCDLAMITVSVSSITIQCTLEAMSVWIQKLQYYEEGARRSVDKSKKTRWFLMT